MSIDRSDQVWVYNDRSDRFVIAYVHSSTNDDGHNVTVFYSSDESIWELGLVRWAESRVDPWENDPGHFTRLI